MTTTLIVLGIVAVVVVYFVFVYNGLVRARNAFKNAFSQIDVQLQRRYDLVPNLVETAKAYMSHERETLEAVTAARNLAQNAAGAAARNPGDGGAMKALGGAEAALGGALGRLFMVSEAYPELKADANMRELQEELTTTENRVSFARQAFNDSVMTYNNEREQFPNNIVSGVFNFAHAEQLEIDSEEAREPMRVSFS